MENNPNPQEMSASDRPTCSRFVLSSSVNDKIIDYYLKYAKDRDIEKFMRFSNSHCRSASSEESEYIVSVHKLYDDNENECPNKFPQNQGQMKQTKETISVVQTDIGTRTPLLDGESNLAQPSDSVTKNDKKLEWDSLGDVGYRKANSTGNISSLERSVLKELFSDSPSEPNISLQRSNEIKISSTNSVGAQNKREQWRETLETLGKKYSSFSASLDTQEFMEQPQSTPKLLPNTEKSCQTTFNKRKVEPRQKDLSIQTTIDQRTLRRAFSVEPQQKDLSVQNTLGQKSSRPSQKDESVVHPSAHTRKEHRSSRQSSITEPCHVDHSTQTSRNSSSAAPNLVNHSAQTSFDQKSSRRLLTRDSNPVNHSAQTSFDQRYSRRLQNSEKYCQTSLAKLRSQEVQANLSSRTGSFATQSSFEYFAGESTSSKSSGRSVLSEKISTHNTKSRPSSDSDKENQLTRRSIKPKNGLDLGIKLLCSLIDAKNLTATQKKSLAKKIFEKIVKQQSGTSTSASLTSRSSVFSVPSLIDSSPQRKNEKNRSEVVAVSKDKGKSKSMSKLSDEIQTDSPREIEESPPKITSPMEAPKTFRKVAEERRTVTPKVSDENPLTTSSSLDEPVTMREWLHPLTRSEKDYDKRMKKKSNQELSPQVSERQKQLSWIEKEINRLEGLKNLLIQERPPSNVPSKSSKSSVQSTGRAEVIYEETIEAVVNPVDKYKRTTQRTSENVVIYDEPTTDNGKQPEVEYKTTRVVINEEQLTSSSGSMKNHRSKLETPVVSPDCVSVSAFANQLQKQFMDSYSKKERCMSEHYSEPRECGKPVFTRNPSYTSVASSAFCMSSEMSIPIVESSSTSTTTHQYDSNGCESVEGVAVQTTYSVIKTNPIFGPRCQCVCRCGVQCKCSCPRPTVRVSGNVFHQTVQVKPKALAYVIRFGETDDDYEKKSNEECLSLQQRLEKQNPDFCSKAEKRREILKKLHNLRQQREQQIREIADNSNVSSILRNLDQLPPPPIKNVRVLPTREMKSMTNKRYRKLPEVVAKQELEKLERRKRSTRVLTRIFNKKLQRMVHNGKLSLEFSRTVI